MLRDSSRSFRTIAAALVGAVVLSACGIKGPLTPAPKPDAAKETTTKDAGVAPATKPPAALTP